MGSFDFGGGYMGSFYGYIYFLSSSKKMILVISFFLGSYSWNIFIS